MVLGTTFDVELSSAHPSSGAVLVHAFGVLPLPLLSCTFYPTLPFCVTGVTAPNVEGEGAVTLSFPPTSALTGKPFYLQCLVADPGGEFDGVASFSPVLEVLVGP